MNWLELSVKAIVPLSWIPPVGLCSQTQASQAGITKLLHPSVICEMQSPIPARDNQLAKVKLPCELLSISRIYSAILLRCFWFTFILLCSSDETQSYPTAIPRSQWWKDRNPYLVHLSQNDVKGMSRVFTICNKQRNQWADLTQRSHTKEILDKV